MPDLRFVNRLGVIDGLATHLIHLIVDEDKDAGLGQREEEKRNEEERDDGRLHGR